MWLGKRCEMLKTERQLVCQTYGTCPNRMAYIFCRNCADEADGCTPLCDVLQVLRRFEVTDEFVEEVAPSLLWNYGEVI